MLDGLISVSLVECGAHLDLPGVLPLNKHEGILPYPPDGAPRIATGHTVRPAFLESYPLVTDGPTSLDPFLEEIPKQSWADIKIGDV